MNMTGSWLRAHKICQTFTKSSQVHDVNELDSVLSLTCYDSHSASIAELHIRTHHSIVCQPVTKLCFISPGQCIIKFLGNSWTEGISVRNSKQL